MKSPILKPEEYSSLLEEVIQYFDEHCVYRVHPEYQASEYHPKGKIVSVNPGSYGTYNMFSRRLTQNVKMLRKVSKLLLHNICVDMNDENPKRQLAGTESSSIPVILGIAYEAEECGIDLNTFTVKKSRKPGGLFNYVEGIPNKNPVLLIDDNVHSGSSLWVSIAVCLHELKLSISDSVYCILYHRTEKDVLIKYQDLNTMLTVKPLFYRSSLNIKYDPDRYWIPDDVVQNLSNTFSY